MCIRDRVKAIKKLSDLGIRFASSLSACNISVRPLVDDQLLHVAPVSYTHLRAHETVLDLVCRLLLEQKKTRQPAAPQRNPI